MKKNPNNVTILGASHNGSSCTKPFHYIFLAKLFFFKLRNYESAHSVSGCSSISGTCRRSNIYMILGELRPLRTRTRAQPALQIIALAKILLIQGRCTLLLGVIGVFGVVTGRGSKAACGSVFTASKFRGRMVA
jgi:hypothetical protein